VRAGIVAADPKFFPLARYLELYIGRNYLGRFLVDDTGKRIRGNRIDVWTSSCHEARRFGIQHGTAVLVHPPKIDVRQAGSAVK
jgi:3D (Asp-Asp-Asp) domain-containing protein